MRNFIDEIEEEMYKGEDFVTLGLNKSYEFLASMEAWETNDRIFNTVEEIELLLGSKVEVPVKHIPRSCNIVGFEIDDTKFCVYLPDENFTQSEDFVYLRLNEKKNKFTPERLLGVETDKGFITNVVEIGFHNIIKPSYYVYTTESLSKEDLYDVHSTKYYISDESDETVSFEEYVKLFYDVEGVL